MTKIKLHGYKRMLGTDCNVDADLIALVGPNEAGKTTVLEALDWLSSGGQLDQRKVNRALDPEQAGPVVTAVFAVEPSDRGALTDVMTDITPRSVRYSRYQDGKFEICFEPRLTRQAGIGRSVLQKISSPKLSERVQDTNAEDALPHAMELAESGNEWDDGDARTIEALIRWLELPTAETVDNDADDTEPVGHPPPHADIDAARLLRDWRDQMTQPHPEVAAREAINRRLPEFLLFTEADRQLGFEYDLRSRSVSQGGQSQRVPSEDVQHPDGGLKNLLKLGGTSIREIYDLVQLRVPARTKGHVRSVNKRLNEAIAPYWSQRELQVVVEVSDTTLRVFIEDGADISQFTDRSDGLRTFVALIAFLAQHASEPPPILLIDEADTHLHYDAQADLINFLQSLPTRTIYTTHSPGCLPLDLGTGVRVVRPDLDTSVSTLSNNFWESNQPGLSPLLFAMGAGAAAFSALRSAVFAEGPSDMMLLPSLIREATGEQALGYQVVSGLASIHPDHLGQTDFAAARVAYLLDGDEGGDQHKTDLRKADVPPERILQLPRGIATEDLIEPDTYLEAVNGVLGDSNRPERVNRDNVQAIVAQGTPIAKAVEDVLGGPNHAPGKVAVAGRLVRHEDALPLTADARETLAKRHAQLVSLFEERGGS